MASLIHAPAHGLVANQPFSFANVTPADTGIDESATYYVLAAGLTANDFEFSTTVGGAAFVLLLPVTGGSIVAPDVYAVVADGVMDPPTAVPTPSAPTVASALVSGIVRLQITLNST